MEYLVTGATGLIGSHVVEQLVAADHDVVALTRSRDNAAHLPDPVEIAEGDITSKDSLREPMAGVDGVFHIAAWYYVGPGRGNLETAQRINVEGTRNVLELMAELHIPHGVYTSTLGVYPFRQWDHIDETVTPEQPDDSVYVRTKWEAHYEVAEQMIHDGLPLVIVQPGTVYGPGDKASGSARSVFHAYLRGNLPLIPRNHSMPWDHVADIADAHIRAMHDGGPGETYIISGPPREFVEIFKTAEAITGLPVPRTVNPKLFAVGAKFMRLLEHAITPPTGFEAESLRFMAGGRYPVDNSKATEQLGICHRSLTEGLRDYLAWEMQELGMDTGL